ncbi:alpha/beta hydrolase [Alkalibacterium pelagium]|uniref:Acetyl esterase/lipase n=1 Tax=Alkalibacterium pelagium TaxID=426702 RepID=A0A1H7LYE9_9LACT|nr:alpha/beta hydrolase [Alkalibacterium pelagium]GEN50989.1 lipase [Alkalibacterium pelagium]SEL03337.1 Acetyl esterase/lipase [Alkalibacterium pelagium]
MSIASLGFKVLSAWSDRKRDKDLTADPSIQGHYDIRYGKSGKYNSLDIYYPKKTENKLPVIINFHGGGYVYGTKENYLHYGMFMARQGFVFVNSNYHLAPKKKYPTQLEELNQVMKWVVANHEDYYIDLNNVYFVGDSVGAQLALQYATMYSNRTYADLFNMTLPDHFTLRAMALNCGVYSILSKLKAEPLEDKKDPRAQLVILIQDYLGKDWKTHEEQLSMPDYLTDALPPVFVMTAEHDFIREDSLPMVALLKEAGVDVTYKKYGEPEDEHLQHIFHCNMNLEEAKICNREETDFFKQHLKR